MQQNQTKITLTLITCLKTVDLTILTCRNLFAFDPLYTTIQLAKTTFQYFSWNDLLRLRRVCHRTYDTTREYLKLNPVRAPEIEINEDSDKSFDAFMNMGIPVTKIFINNPSGSRFYDLNSSSVRKFLNQYGFKIEQLRVTKFTLCTYGNERMFLKGLANLKDFETRHLI